MVMGSPLAALATSVGRLSFLRWVLPGVLRFMRAAQARSAWGNPPAQEPCAGGRRVRPIQSRRRVRTAASYVDQDLRRRLTRSRAAYSLLPSGAHRGIACVPAILRAAGNAAST